MYVLINDTQGIRIQECERIEIFDNKGDNFDRAVRAYEDFKGTSIKSSTILLVRFMSERGCIFTLEVDEHTNVEIVSKEKSNRIMRKMQTC